MKQQLIRFVLRWSVNSLGLLVSANLFHLVQYDHRLSVALIGGLILSLLNIVIKPILVIITLPAIAMTLGLFMVVINGIVVLTTAAIYKPLDVGSFWAAVLVGVVIGLVNYIVTIVAEALERNHV